MLYSLNSEKTMYRVSADADRDKRIKFRMYNLICIKYEKSDYTYIRVVTVAENT